MELRKIYIFTSESFPKGKAASNRILCYANGIKGNDIPVEVICFWRNGNHPKDNNNLKRGNYQGIDFQYLGNRTYKSKNPIIKRLDVVADYIKLSWFSLNRVSENSLSIIYSHRSVPVILLWMSHLLKRSRMIKEVNEHPETFLRKKNNIQKYLFLKLHFFLFHGYLVMTDQLMNFLSKDLGIKKPLLKVPMTVDIERFTKANGNVVDSKEIVYAGQLDDRKDGINILLQAFKTIVSRHPEYSLSLYGKAFSQKQMDRYYDLVRELGVEDKVKFHGLVDRETITKRLQSASILVLPRPNSVQAQYGFPTKLGEYLATANPVIATSVGDIPKYLTDEVNVFMISPGDIVELSNKLEFVIENYPYAKKIAQAGKSFAEEKFDLNNQARRIISFAKEKF